MHIVILADPIDDQKAGVHIYTKKLTEELLKLNKKSKNRHKYTFIHKQKNNFFENTNHFIVPKKSIRGYGTYRKFFLIPRLLKKLKPDIIFEPCHIGPFRTPKNCKRVVMIHDLTPILFPNFHIKTSTIIHKLLLKRVLKKADLILTASNNTKKDILNYCTTKAKIPVIPLGVDQKTSRKISGSKNNFPYFLYLGTIEPRKNLELLIEAFSELKQEKKFTHKLIIAGEIGWKSEKILKKIKQANKKIPSSITLKGYVSEKEKSQLYQNAEIFIYLSFYEGFGLPVLEAMSYNTPVICSNTSSLKEYFENYALTFDPKNKKELKKQIMKLVEDKIFQKKLTQKAFTYSKNFNWKKTAEKTLRNFSFLID